MDFSRTDEQCELAELADRILADACTPEHLRAVAESDSGIDLDLWCTLAAAGLVGIGLPEPAGGGFGWLETAVVLEAIGRHAAPLPALGTMAMAATALAAAAAEGVADAGDLLAALATGERIVTSAVHEPNGDVFAPSTTASGDRITGHKTCLPFGSITEAFVVTTADGLWLVGAGADGVTVETQRTSSGPIAALVDFDEAHGLRLGGVAARDRMVEHGISAACLISAGACARVVELTSEYTKGRHQFGKPIASFQAVSQRAADAYVDAEAVRLTAWQAAWRLAEGVDARRQLLTAKFWAAEGGWRAVHAAHHLHGGFGVDRDYPLHHYLLLLQRLELQLGSATPSLAALGDLIASTA